MFQFTREFIINDNVGKLTDDKKKFVFDDATETLFVDNMINIRKKDVHAIYKNKFQAEANEKVTVNLSGAITASGLTIAASDVVRLVITLGLRGKTSATFNDQYPDHSRQLFYEEVGKTAAADIVAGLVASADHERTLSPEVFAKLVDNENGTLTIEAPDCYTIIKEVRVVKLPVEDPEAKIAAILTGYEDWDQIVVWARKGKAEGSTEDNVTFDVAANEGNGNTVQILKNMRLQTWGNINPYGTNIDERPVPKGQYDQFTVEMVTERRHIGHDVMGSVGTSLTTLVFYVLASGTCDEGVSSEFEGLLSKLCKVEAIAKPSAAVGDGLPKQILEHTKPEEGGSSAASE